MKQILVILSLIVLLSCEKTTEIRPDNDNFPLNCYSVSLLINSTSGEIIDQEISFVFVSEPGLIEKWKNDEGINITKDTVNHIVKIQMIQCVEPDVKNN